MAKLERGTRVRLVAGGYIGQAGTITGFGSAGYYRIRLDGGKEIGERFDRFEIEPDSAKELADIVSGFLNLGGIWEVGNAYISRAFVDKWEDLRARAIKAIGQEGN